MSASSSSLAGDSAFDAFYGLEFIEFSSDEARGRLRIEPHHLQPTGIVHGGVYASIAEALASTGTNHSVTKSGQIALGVANSTNFIRPASKGCLHATATPIKRGPGSWIWDVEIRDDEERRCAVSRVTLAIRAARPRSRAAAGGQSTIAGWSDGARLAIVGGGTMGAGIAALACERGIPTVLCEVDADAAAAARERVEELLKRRQRRGRIDGAGLAAARGRLQVAEDLAAAAPASMLIEAAPERLELKRDLLARLAAIAPSAVLASNTSSIPIAELAAGTEHAARVLGLHFFNPPGAIDLVELVSTPATAPEAVRTAREAAEALGRRPVAVADGPGFLVNRCARPFYLQSLRIVAAGAAEPAAVDAALEAEGFPLGPFRLMDLIGIDIGLAVARSLWEQAGREPRWRPSPIQEAMVAAGRLGRKSGGGFYDADGAPLPLPSSVIPTAAGRGLDDGEIVAQVGAQLANEAHFALAAGVAPAAAVDMAMVAALRWPRGPIAWGREIGHGRVAAILDELAGPGGDPVYRVAPGLRNASAETSEQLGSGT